MTPQPQAAPAFLSRAVAPALLEDMLARSSRAPSGVNTQPWKICSVQGAARATLVQRAQARLPELLSQPRLQQRFWQQYKRQPGRVAWPGPPWERYADDFLACTDAAFGAGRLSSLQRLSAYFGLHQAPVALVCTIDGTLGLGSLLDWGMFVQNLVLSAAPRGLHVEPQPGWKGLSDLVLELVGAPEGELLVTVLAVGHVETPISQGPVGPSAPLGPRFVRWHA